MNALTVHPLPYHGDMLPYYQTLCHCPGFALLDSGGQGRFDIVTAYPYQRYQQHRNHANGQQVWQELKHLLPKQLSDHDYPFQGGAIGYFSYDFAAQLAGIEQPIHPLLQHIPLVDLGLYDWAIITDHQRQQVNLVAANQRLETPAIIKEILAQWKKTTVKSLDFQVQQAFKPLISREAYQHAFAAIKQDLVRGRAYQVNYTQPFMGYFHGDPWQIYRRIRHHNPVPFAAFLQKDDTHILSFSPERFLRMQQQQLLTSPIKGTAKRSADPKQDQQLLKALMQCPKNRAENVMIVDLMRNDLGRFAMPGSIQVQALCEAQSFSSVHHLVSHIVAHCPPSVAPMDALAACFPGGSITGAPKLEAMQIIGEHEPYSRGLYCGSIGYFSNHGQFDTNIAIRTLTCRAEQIYMAAGGGIVIDSHCEEEYQECYTKIAAILKGLS